MHQEQSRSRSDRFKSIFKNSILTLSVLVIAISTISGSINANARQQEILNQELFNNPQAILNVTFKDNVYLDNIIDNELNSDKNWQGLKFDNSTFGVTSLSGLSNIGGVEEMVSINGQYSTRSIKKSYKDKLQELIVKIDDIKNNNQPSENETIKTELAKMNNWEVKKQRYVNWSQSKILSISLVGNSNTLDIIKEILDKSGHVKISNIINSKLTIEAINLVSEKINSEISIEKETNKDPNLINEISDRNISKMTQEILNQNGIYNSLEESISDNLVEIKKSNNPPIQNLLEETNTNSIETTTSKIGKSLVGGIDAKAWGYWDGKVGLEFCGWYPCAIKLWMSKDIANNIANALGITMGLRANPTSITGVSAWIWSYFARFTVLCGNFVLQCNAILSAVIVGIIYKTAGSFISYDGLCKQMKWTGGITFKVSMRNFSDIGLWCEIKF
jgi:hypothetical protein